MRSFELEEPGDDVRDFQPGDLLAPGYYYPLMLD
jgi:hypothetical protein